ncbi:MAG: F-box protein [Verrucomicrobia bacterium]|nr:F-box protein [Verrucomicrobiota bacterium]
MEATQVLSPLNLREDDAMQVEGFEEALPLEMIFQILLRCDHVGALKASRVCKSWQALSTDSSTAQDIWKNIFYKELVFAGEREWGELGYKVTLPERDYRQVTLEALKWAHDKWPKNWDRKMMFFCPKEIVSLATGVAAPASPVKIGAVIGPLLGPDCNATGYRYFWPKALQAHGGKTLQESCWVYMTPDVIPDSTWKDYGTQCDMAKAFGGGVTDLPSVVTGTLLKDYATGKRLFSDIFTLCQESIGRVQLVVESFAPSGLRVNHDLSFFDIVKRGVVVVRKF